MTIQSKPPTEKYRMNWDAIFRHCTENEQGQTRSQPGEYLKVTLVLDGQTLHEYFTGVPFCVGDLVHFGGDVFEVVEQILKPEDNGTDSQRVVVRKHDKETLSKAYENSRQLKSGE